MAVADRLVSDQRRADHCHQGQRRERRHQRRHGDQSDEHDGCGRPTTAPRAACPESHGTCAAMYSAKPPHRPIAGMIPSDSSTWLSVSSSMPHLRTEVVNGQRGDREQDEVQGADEEVRDSEDDGLRTERRRRRECHDQHGAAAAKTANRTAPSFGSTVFVSQAYVPHAHHSAASEAPRAAVLPRSRWLRGSR